MPLEKAQKEGHERFVYPEKRMLCVWWVKEDVEYYDAYTTHILHILSILCPQISIFPVFYPTMFEEAPLITKMPYKLGLTTSSTPNQQISLDVEWRNYPSFVRIFSLEPEKFQSNGFVVRSEVADKGYGRFVELDDDIKPCGDSGSAIQNLGDRWRSFAEVRWIGDAGSKGTCVHFLASIKGGHEWTKISTTICLIEDCYIIIASHHGTIDQETIASNGCLQTYIIFQRPLEDQIFLQFRELNLPADDDDENCTLEYLEVYTGVADAHIPKLCGLRFENDMKYLGFKSEKNLLILKSKLSQNSSFRAVYYTLDKRKGCNQTFSSSEGHISSPNFPDFYFPNLDCYMVVVVIPGQKVSLYVKTVQIQADHPLTDDEPSCTRDFLEILVGNTTLRRLCGETDNLAPSDLEVSSDVDVILHFKSDFAKEDRGFLIEYRHTKFCRNETRTEANGTLFAAPTNATGVRMARNCYVVVHVPLGFLIEVNVSGAISANKSEAFANCSGAQAAAAVSSLVEIVDRDVVWVKCVDHEPDASFVSSSNALAVRLVTRPPSRGVTATYRAIPANASVLECDYGWVAGEHYCYVLESDAQPWEEAEEICQGKGGHLASVGNAQVQTILEEIIKTSLIFSDDIALWIGGNDRVYENCYEWSNGRPFGYTNWFSGWPQNNFYKSQPSDDGLANEDCIEMRRNYRYAAKGEGVTDHFYWNDRDCRVANPFICEKLKPGVILDPYPPDCNRSISLSADKMRDVLTSPGHPDPYPHNVECFTVIHAPPGFRLVLTFSAFHLEDDANCKFDYLEISEPSGQSVRHCGDWSGRLKLLRYESVGHVLHVLFVADYSHSFIGYKAEVALDQGRDQCDDGRLHPFNNYCYLFVSYPEVTWQTAHQICSEMQGHLASVWSQPEQNFIIERIKRMEAYSSGTIYWLGGFRRAITDTWQWVDASAFNYTDWYPGWVAEKNEALYGTHHLMENEESCLAAQWKSIKDLSGRLKYSGLYWSSHGCEYNGGYVCKKKKLVISENLNRTFRGAAGSLASPNFPLSYANNLRYTVHIVGPPRTRILFQVTKLDMEWQEDCLYDSVGLQSTPEGPITRFCGLNTIDPYRLDFVSESNHLYVTFQSDYSITGAGFEAQWKAVDISGCPTILTNVQSGTLQSVNYPDIYIHSLDCDATVRVPEGKRVWLEFRKFEVGTPSTGAKNECEDDYVQVILNHDRKVTLCGNLTDKLPELKFLTYGNLLQLNFHSDTKIAHLGYFATFRAVDRLQELAVVPLRPNMTDEIHGMNFPLLSPPAVNLTRHLSAPVGHVIELRFPQSKLIRRSANDTCTHGKVQLSDPYKPENPKGWTLCNADHSAMAEEYVFRSYLNSFYLTEITSPTAEYRAFATSYSVIPDPEFDNKTLAVAFITTVDSCNPNPCINQAKCVETEERAVCRCTKYFAGLFCHLTKCESDPCMYGTCNLTETDYVCICDKGYGGRHCEERLTPCASNPCGPRGTCVNHNDTFSCRCHVWWEGSRCEKRIFKIPYRPLSQRMLEEPFWLGLITVSIVLLVLGCVWCIKRKFADKLERFLAEEIERSKQQREQHRARSPSVQKLNKLGVGVGVRERSSPVQASPPQGPRSLFSRLGRRKHSMLNLGAAAAPAYQENRSFSFDDLLRKGPSRLTNRGGAISGGGGGGGATTGGFGATVAPEEETKEILQSLVTPATKSRERRMSFEEFIQLSEQKIKEAVHEGREGEATGATGTEVRSGEGEMRETSFLTPPRPHKSLKKKVSFAKFVETAAESLAAASRQMAMSTSLSAPEDPFQPPNPVLNSRPSCAIEVSPPDSEQVSQATKSDTEDVTSGDDVSIEVPVFSSSSSSPETPARSLQGRLNGGDSTPSSPVVVVHQPPPNKDSPKRCLDSLSKLVINLSENEQDNFNSDEDELEEDDEDEGLIMVVGKTRESRAAVPEAPSTAVGEEQEDEVEEGVVIPTKQAPNIRQDPNDSTTVFRCLETLSPDNPLQKLALDSPLEYTHSLVGGNLLSPPKEMILQKAGKKVELPVSKSLQLDKQAAAVKKSTELRLSEDKQTPHLIAEELAKVKELAPEKDNSNKVHAIDDLAEALEKKRLRELLSPQPIQIPIFSMYDSRWPYQRKSSLDAAMLRVPDSFPKKPEMSHLTLPPLGTPLSALTPGVKGTYGIPIHPLPAKLTASPPFQRKSPQLVPSLHGEMDAVRLKGKPPPLQIPKLLLESPPRRRVKGVDKPNSLDIPAPVITITSNMSSCDSDTDSPIKAVGASGNIHASSQYLTPFVMLCPTEDMSTSMSNLSSSGYSSMASPGPSRCGSNNPLCPSSENEQDPPTPRQMANKPFMKAGFLCPPSTSMFQPRARLLSGDRTPSSREVSPPSGKTSPAIRKRSDSETTDEPPEPSVSIDDSNEDEGIGMEGSVFREPDHRQNTTMGLRVLRMDPKSPPPPFFTTSSPTSTAMRVGVALMNESVQIPERDTGPSPVFFLIPASPKCELAPPVSAASTSATPPPPSDPVPPPVIVVQEGSDSDASANDIWRSVRRKSFERKLSPVSSRSESPLSDRGQASIEHFSPQFYGNSDAVGGVIYTDSDGLYDCPSSEVAPPSITKPVNKRQSRRRERHQVRHKAQTASASGPPNLPVAPRHKQVAELAKERLITARRTSPKRRTRAPVAKDADSSSSDSSSTSASAQDQLLVHRSPTPDQSTREATGIPEIRSPIRAAHRRKGGYNRADTTPIYPRREFKKSDNTLNVRDTAGSSDCGSSRSGGGRHDASSSGSSCNSRDSKITVKHVEIDDSLRAAGRRTDGRNPNPVSRVFRRFGATNKRDSLESPIESTDSDPDSHTTLVAADVHRANESRTSGETAKRPLSVSNRKMALPLGSMEEDSEQMTRLLSPPSVTISREASGEDSHATSCDDEEADLV